MKEKFYLTTAIAYTSSKPHIGNVFEIVLTDAIARFRRMQGYDVFFLTGTDEHGIKIQQKAEAKGVTPKQYVDEVAGEIRRMWDLFGASYDKFIRTTDEYHEKAVSKIFTKLYEQGDIYKSSYEGWYCTPCESFWTESQAVDGCCPDCGAKLHFCAAKSLKRNQEFWRCSNYKDGRGACKIHYIRDVVLEKIVFEAISGLADFVKCHETVFLYMLAKRTNAMRQKEHKKLQQTVEQGTRRIAEIDRLIEKVFEQNASGILSDERFSKMLQSYEKEQKALIQEVADSQKALQEAKQKVTDLRLLLRTLRELTDITELTPTLVNALIERIEVHNNDKSSGHCFVKVDIYFTAAGMIDIPTEQEILAMMKEIRENPQDFRFVA